MSTKFTSSVFQIELRTNNSFNLEGVMQVRFSENIKLALENARSELDDVTGMHKIFCAHSYTIG